MLIIFFIFYKKKDKKKDETNSNKYDHWIIIIKTMKIIIICHIEGKNIQNKNNIYTRIFGNCHNPSISNKQS